MSFTFNWPRFSDQFHYDAIQMLNTALNKGNKPPIIADKIEVVELEMGTQPPELEIRDIGELTVDQFRGIFRLTYSGDAHLVLKTKVQANPLNHKQPDIHLMTGSHGMLAAKDPLVVPMLLRLSHFRLNSYVVLVVSKQKGITLVFKTDPLQNVDINSTFDSIAVIQKYIQREIEGQLRQMFREDLPGIIHRLSQQWVKAKVEAPYLNKRPPPVPLSQRQRLETMSNPDLPLTSLSVLSHSDRTHSLGLPNIRKSRSVSGHSIASSNRRANKVASKDSSSLQTSSTDVSSHGEYEGFDPTYGLRPEGIPTKSGFKAFSNLFTPNKGLADLTEEDGTDEDEDLEDDEVSTTFDVIDWEDTIPRISPPSSLSERNTTPEYETIPAVGGGTITRPRVLHSQSSIQVPQGITPRTPQLPLQSRLQANTRPGDSSPSVLSRHHPSGSAYFSDVQSMHNTLRPPSNYPLRPRTPGSSDAGLSDEMNDHYLSYPNPTRRQPPVTPSHAQAPQNFHDTNSIDIHPPHSKRRLSVSSSVSYRSAATATSQLHPNSVSGTSPIYNSISTSPSNHHSDSNSKHVLRPSLNNNSLHHLSTLSHSNHTLSPYTRSLSHFTVRSVPPRAAGVGSGSGLSALGSTAATGDRKAKRKRIFRFGGKSPTDSPNTSMSADTLADTYSTNSNKLFSNGDANQPVQMTAGLRQGSRMRHLRQHGFVPSEFDAEDMDRYFRSNEDISSIPPAPSTVDSGRMSSTPPRFSTLQAVQQHLQQRPLANGVDPRALVPGIGGPNTVNVSARRR